jgi:hypothetical protein
MLTMSTATMASSSAATTPSVAHGVSLLRPSLCDKMALRTWDPGVVHSDDTFTQSSRSIQSRFPSDIDMLTIHPLTMLTMPVDASPSVNHANHPSVNHACIPFSLFEVFDGSSALASPMVPTTLQVAFYPVPIQLTISRLMLTIHPVTRVSIHPLTASTSPMASSSGACALYPVPIQSLFHYSHPILSRPTVPNIQA